MREKVCGADAVELTAAIVAAYVSKNATPVADLPGLIASVNGALNQLSAPPAAEPAPLVPPVPIKKTVTPDYIISLEDGKPYKSLKRHLGIRGLTPDEYRKKWGLPHGYPMVAANYAAKRSELAKSLALGQSRRPASSEGR
ncbi:transcriptional regulator, MucR family [Methylobacterium sp. 4-46]|uniref:MucR family transcriptional regulator n=1 Tax=unclassified Methylobacterium TaxID=2615210 RepID=UPI000152E897|nr:MULTISPECIES: MucR family transcriptional regulator [Methylobacterium]ACA18473.1 transcriptional regulator, MucR family [Methylobacterium sp. 4-46]WFT77762.1 MucR family transcriptional regulator [Methylobacterium nodulans]